MTAGCAAQKVQAPEPPIASRQQPVFPKIKLQLETFSVAGRSETDTTANVDRMRSRFLEYVNARMRFAGLVDESRGFLRGSGTQPVTLGLEVNLKVDHSEWRTYILDLFAVYPFVCYWPLTPQWGDAKVEVSALIRQVQDRRVVWSGEATAEVPYSIIWYSWFRTEPLEKSYAEAAGKAFTELIDALAMSKEAIYAKLGDIPEQPTVAAATERPNIDTTVRGLANNGWVVAVMETMDINAGVAGLALDPTLMKNLTDQLRIFIAQRGVRVVDRGQQAQLFQEIMTETKAESYKDCYDESCQIPLGKSLAASHILRSKVTRFGSACVLNAELIDLLSEVTVAASSARSDCSAEGFLTASESLATTLVGATN